jgi:hypothetical protein
MSARIIPLPTRRRPPPPDLCAWCFEPLGAEAHEVNGGFGHPKCAEYVFCIVEGPDAPPYRPQRRFYTESGWNDFLRRLGAAAVRHGIDTDRLARAFEEARR